MAPCIKVPIPDGQLKVAFVGDEPKVSGIAEDSPMYGIFKIGYKFKELILGDGAIMTGLDTNELVSALNEHSNEPNRMIKLEMSLPAESTVVLQSGAHGLIIEHKFGHAILTRINYDSPLRKEIRVGMVVDTVELEDGYKICGFAAEEINDALTSSEKHSKRTLILRSPDSKLSTREAILPKFKKIELPTGTAEEVGIKLAGESAKILSVIAGTPLDGIARPGFVIDTLKHPDGHEFRGLSANEMTGCINSTNDATGRVVILKNPTLNKILSIGTTKIMLPSEGNLEDFGISVEGSTATISGIHSESLYRGMINRGFKVSTCGWADGTEFEALSAVELDEVIRDSSGLEGRYILLENQAAVAPSVMDVKLPPGKLGAVFKGVPPRLTRLSGNSPLNGLVEFGMAVDMLMLSNGAIYYEMDTIEFTNALKSSSDDPGREIRFINLDENELTKKPVIERADEMNVSLPTGKLSVTFKGSNRAVVSTVKDSSPLSGIVPEGMAVDFVTVGHRDYMELGAVDLAQLLKSTSDVPGRTMKLRNAEDTDEFSKIPDELDVILPSGKLGCTFSGTPPTAKSFKDNSPIASAIPPGMFVDKLILSDGYTMSGFTTKEFVGGLGRSGGQEGRILVLKSTKSRNPSPQVEVFPDDKMIVLPTGKLGVSFKGRKQARVSRLHDGSSLQGEAYVGMLLDSITIPGGSTFSGMTAKEAARVLVDTKMVGGRTMMLKSPGSNTMSTRNIENDDASIGGTSQNMSEDFSRRVG